MFTPDEPKTTEPRIDDPHADGENVVLQPKVSNELHEKVQICLEKNDLPIIQDINCVLEFGLIILHKEVISILKQDIRIVLVAGNASSRGDPRPDTLVVDLYKKLKASIQKLVAPTETAHMREYVKLRVHQLEDGSDNFLSSREPIRERVASIKTEWDKLREQGKTQNPAIVADGGDLSMLLHNLRTALDSYMSHNFPEDLKPLRLSEEIISDLRMILTESLSIPRDKLILQDECEITLRPESPRPVSTISARAEESTSVSPLTLLETLAPFKPKLATRVSPDDFSITYRAENPWLVSTGTTRLPSHVRDTAKNGSSRMSIPFHPLDALASRKRATVSFSSADPASSFGELKRPGSPLSSTHSDDRAATSPPLESERQSYGHRPFKIPRRDRR